MPAQTVVVKAQPGVKRDGTRFDGDFYTDAQWVRFQRGLPRKIGGYRSISKFLSQTSRGFTTYADDGLVYCHSGGSSKLERFTIDIAGNSSVIFDRTPAGLTASANNKWMFDYAYNTTGLNTNIIAHCAPNNSSMANSAGGQIFIGDTLGTAALTAVSLPSNANATGGIVNLSPYLFYYGTAGIIGWSKAGHPSDLTTGDSGQARPWGTKIIKGMPLRAGAGSAPAGLFIAYDAVLRSSFVGGSALFNFDTLATGTSIMSPDAVVDFDGTIFWAGVDRFFAFNGVVREVPNNLSMNWFFDNVNRDNKSKVFAFKVPRYGEIWWCYPRDGAAECTHAVIYNVRENTWYDTPLPLAGRTAGTFSNFFPSPVLVSSEASTGLNKVWIHESGVDEVDGQLLSPIKSYFETCDISWVALKGENRKMRIAAIEPDFIQSGPMTFQVTGRSNARAPDVYSAEFPLPATPTTTSEQIIPLKEQRRELRVRFQSNAVGGDFQMGKILAHLEQGDGTMVGG
jgi:hypothetical protein